MMLPGLETALLAADDRARLEALGPVVTPSPILDARELDDTVRRRITIVLTSWGCPPFGPDALAALPHLEMVAHAAGTVRSLATDELFATGVRLTSAAAANAVPVAEFTFAAIVMCGKQVFAIRDRHRQQRGRGWAAAGFELGNRGRRIGVVGASLIGRMVIERLATLDCQVVVSDPYLDTAEAHRLGVTKTDLDSLCASCDIVSLHAPELPSTRHMIGAAQLGAMADGAWLINTARGSLVDTAALENEVVAGRLNAVIDTPDPEPLPPESPLYDLPNVVLTPHIAGSLGNELPRMGALAVTEIERFITGEAPLHPVHAADLERIA